MLAFGFFRIFLWFGKLCHHVQAKTSLVLTQKWSPFHFFAWLKKEEAIYGLSDDVSLLKHYPCTQPFYLCLIDGASGSIECSYRSCVAS